MFRDEVRLLAALQEACLYIAEHDHICPRVYMVMYTCCTECIHDAAAGKIKGDALTQRRRECLEEYFVYLADRKAND